jgi:hypothetical protein
MDDLIRPSVPSRHHTDRILNCKRLERSLMPIDEFHEEVDTLLLASIGLFLLEPPGTAARQMSAWRECDDHVPVAIHDFQNITLEVIMAVATFARENVARPSVVPAINEAVANPSAIFTSN